MSPAALALHACGYDGPRRVCRIALNRIEKVLELSRDYNIKNLIITGGVRFDSTATLWLAELIQESTEQMERRRPDQENKPRHPWLNFFLQTNCYNSSTDTHAVLERAKEQGFESIVAVSSFWHLWVLKPLYAYWAKQLVYDGKLCFKHPDVDQRSLKTIFTYAVYALVVRATLALGIFPLFDRWLNEKQAGRVNSFPISGCD